MSNVRVRFAPSPTGFLHVGGLRTALYNELFARRHGGTFILRIEDTDRTRLVEGGVENIIRTLHKAGIVPDEGPSLTADGSIVQNGDAGPYIQSERLGTYREHADRLVAEGKAYRCFCTPERLEEVRERQMAAGFAVMYDKHCRDLTADEVDAALASGGPHVVRLKVPTRRAVEFQDAIRGSVVTQADTIDDQVLLKSDGFPTYHLANVVDDHLMRITHVIRGEEWIPSTPKHILLYEAFGWQAPAFAHLPLLLNPDRSKLSKRQGDVAVEDYLAKGYLPEALINFVALLGWNPSDDREIYAKEELAAAFDLSKVNKGGAVFDHQKLDWMNGEYMKRAPSGELAERAMPFLRAAGLIAQDGDGFRTKDGRRISREFVEKAVALEKARVKTLAEIPEALGFLFEGVPSYEGVQIHWKKSSPEAARERLDGLREFLNGVADADFADHERLGAAAMAFVAERGWTNADSLWPLRVALTGRAASPGPFEVATVLGKEMTLARIDAARKSLPG